MLTSLWCYGNPGLLKLPESLAKAPSLKHIWAEGCGLHLEGGAVAALVRFMADRAVGGARKAGPE